MGGFLIIILVSWAPKPYSNFLRPPVFEAHGLQHRGSDVETPGVLLRESYYFWGVEGQGLLIQGLGFRV